MILKSGNEFYYRGSSTGRNAGIGFIVNKSIKNIIIKFESIDRAEMAMGRVHPWVGSGRVGSNFFIF